MSTWKTWRKIAVHFAHVSGRLKKLALMMISVALIDSAFPLMTRYAIDEIITPAADEKLKAFALVYMGLILGLALMIFLFIHLSGKIEAAVVYDLRRKAFTKLQRLPVAYYDKNNDGWIISRLTSDISKIGDTLAWGMVDLVWGMSTVLLIACIMLSIHWRLALVTLTVVPLLALAALFFQKKMIARQREVRKYNATITGRFSEAIHGAIVSKIIDSAARQKEDFKGLVGDMYGEAYASGRLSSFYQPLVMSIGTLGTIFALVQGGLLAEGGAISYGTYVLFINYAMRLFDPIVEMSRVFSELISSEAAVERVVGLFEEAEDPARELAVAAPVTVVQRGALVFDHVSFAYEPGTMILEDFSFQVRAGETVAFVGETGSGKSTLVNLMIRFYEPTEGGMLVDGIPYSALDHGTLRSYFGYVLQKPQLFSGTIADNILYGRPAASREEMIRAAKITGVHEMIRHLEEGYETVISEEGSNLSLGQKQLIAMARAILSDPKILILDEATSSVDPLAEQSIQRALDRVMSDRTSIIIAHRLATVKKADRICVLSAGKIVESGDHRTLMKKRGQYYQMVSRENETISSHRQPA